MNIELEEVVVQYVSDDALELAASVAQEAFTAAVNTACCYKW